MAADESIKRQRYLQLCADHDIDALIILDSDEYVDKKNTDWPAFRNEISETITEQSSAPYVHNVFSLDEFFYGTIKERPRLWVYPSQMEYLYGLHYRFKNKYHNYDIDKVGMYAVGRKLKQFSFRFVNDHTYRPKMRRVQHDEYQNWLIQHEIEINKRLKK